jgi:hypothetical protein
LERFLESLPGLKAKVRTQKPFAEQPINYSMTNNDVEALIADPRSRPVTYW